MKQPKVYFRKLGRENADGQATDEGRKQYIEIDSRLKGRRLLDTFIHERIHLLFPELSEDAVEEKSSILMDFLWSHGYRKTDG